ncbi:hypothetical protein [Nostoc favosum]|uniref:Uncharacterized protein n=1 Tax=Nostoc favosum CHAB5714 TaxID=2780399 RepID=A0ABS8IIS5_9NOSO|nr:hypothetical protein [Nostoc favosum]MCC5604038.1 hypothetical protein [Nostoc favosum CHAB5714]
MGSGEWGVRSEELRSNTSRIISPNTGSSFAIAILNLDKINLLGMSSNS